jgi:hypothetical protein
MIQPVIKTLQSEAQTWLCRQLDRLFYTIENLFRPMTDQFDFDFEHQATPASSCGACTDAEARSAAVDAPPPNVTAADPPAVSAADVILAHQIAAIDNINEPICYCNTHFRTRRAWAQHVIQQLRNTPR